MDDAGPTASIVLFIVLLILDMMFFTFGAALYHLNGKDVEEKATEGKKTAKRLFELLEQVDKYVDTLQLVVTTIHIVMGAVFLLFWKQLLVVHLEKKVGMISKSVSCVSEPVLQTIAMILSILLLLYIILSLGILLPKKVGSKKPELFAYLLVYPVRFFMLILTPMTKLVSVTVKAILGLLHMNNKSELTDVTEEEIIDMVNEGHEQGILEASEAEMINNIFEFGDKEAKDIMTHVHNVVAIEQQTSLQDAIQFMLSENYSRYPVYNESVDQIVGVLYLKDAMKMQFKKVNVNKPICKIRTLIRKAIFIPETLNINTMFQKMQSRKVQMMVVVDEYGQTAGVVTMEDILEEIVGNILDEYDEDEDHIEEAGEDTFLIEGKTPLEELEERFDITFEKENYETLNGFLISQIDRIPEEGEEFEMDYQGYHLKVMSVKNHMIESVEFTQLLEEDEAKLAEEVDAGTRMEE